MRRRLSTTSCIYLGDIGDNGGRRQTVQILKVPEPTTLADQVLIPAILPFRYRGGPVDAEALLVDPRTSRVFVIGKSLLSLGDVYRVDDLGTPFIGYLSDLLFNMQANAEGFADLARASCKGDLLAQQTDAVRAFCTAADAKALQNSLVITAVLYAIPAIFFLLCMKTLQKDLVAK